MVIAYTVVAVVLALANAASGTAKIRRAEPAASTLTAVGVPDSGFVPLAALNYAGAAGLLIGIGWRPQGVAAAAGLVLYFAGALVFHRRAGDTKGMPVPAGLLAASVAALVLGVAGV